MSSMDAEGLAPISNFADRIRDVETHTNKRSQSFRYKENTSKELNNEDCKINTGNTPSLSFSFFLCVREDSHRVKYVSQTPHDKQLTWVVIAG